MDLKKLNKKVFIIVPTVLIIIAGIMITFYLSIYEGKHCGSQLISQGFIKCPPGYYCKAVAEVEEGGICKNALISIFSQGD